MKKNKPEYTDVLAEMYAKQKAEEEDKTCLVVRAKDQIIEVKAHDVDRVAKSVKGDIFLCFKDEEGSYCFISKC